jgi:hypothetical protein
LYRLDGATALSSRLVVIYTGGERKGGEAPMEVDYKGEPIPEDAILVTDELKEKRRRSKLRAEINRRDREKAMRKREALNPRGLDRKKYGEV